MSNDNDMVAYCGLYCGDCFSYTGTIPDLARDLRKQLRQARFEKIAEALSNIEWLKVFKDYKQCYDVLGMLVKMRCPKACKGGGGPTFCKIRKCCEKKGFDGCWQCDEFAKCNKLDFLKPTHGSAHMKNLRIIKREGLEAFLKGKKHWYTA